MRWFYRWPYKSKKPPSRALFLLCLPHDQGSHLFNRLCSFWFPKRRLGQPLLTFPLNPFLFKEICFSLCLREAEPIGLNSPVLFADRKGLPGGAGSPSVEPPALGQASGCPQGRRADSSWQNSSLTRRSLGRAGRGCQSASRKHRRET